MTKQFQKVLSEKKNQECIKNITSVIRNFRFRLGLIDPITNGELQSIQELTSESLDQLRDFIGCLGRGILENFCELPPPIEGGGGAPENKQLHVLINSSYLYL